MSLAPGARLGPYEILAGIGSGAMGDVYRAKDTRLDRIVAIKVCKDQLSERFDREARAVAALNHPHVCQLYDVGPNYLVMEFVDGTPLRAVDNAERLLDIAIQMTDGLATAHAAGIIHRDLKPANILMSRDGQVKILDFGLATLGPLGAAAGDATVAAITNAGTTVGTAAYMSPEQARGQVVDARSDLWAVGVILYEIATGVLPFDGPTTAVMFEGILGRAPVPVQERNPAVPAEIARIIDRLLDKDRETRYQSAADVRADLKRAGRTSDRAQRTATIPLDDLASPATREVRAAASRPRSAFRWAAVTAVTLVLLGAAAFVTYISFSRSPVTSPSEYVQLTNFTDSATAPALSPDGRMVAFIRGGRFFLSGGQIYVKLLPNGEAVQLTNHPEQKLAPMFTPDGTRVAYTLVDRSGAPSWDTWTVPVHGGQATRFLPNAAALQWLDGRRVMFSEIKPPDVVGGAAAGDTMAIPLQGGAPVLICARSCGPSVWSPDGRWFRVTVQGGIGDGESSSEAQRVRALVMPVPTGRTLPELPVTGIPLDPEWPGPPGTRVFDRNIVPGLDPSTYIYVRASLQRNLYRIPIH